MILFKKSQGSQVTEYSPIAKALDAGAKQILKRKFEIAYLICKEDLPFVKMAPICELEERHSVNLGSGYKNDQVPS